MRSLRLMALTVGVLVAAFGPRAAVADAPVAEGDESKGYVAEHFGLRVRVEQNSFKDLNISSRSIGRNDLGLGFSQSLDAQNGAEEKSWRETVEMLDLVYDPFGGEPSAFSLLLGIGGRQGTSDFGTQRTHHGSEPMFEIGGLGTLGRISEGARLDWSARVAHVEMKDVSVDQIPGVDEGLDLKETSYTLRLELALPTAVGGSEASSPFWEPFVGVMYYHINVDEDYQASSGAGVSNLEFESESEGMSDFRGILGARLKGLDRRADLDFGVSIGSQVYGLELGVDIRF